jgi:hypothetical protein
MSYKEQRERVKIFSRAVNFGLCAEYRMDYFCGSIKMTNIVGKHVLGMTNGEWRMANGEW